MRSFLPNLGVPLERPYRCGLFRGRYYPHKNVLLLGSYENEQEIFAGTDRLSMGVLRDRDRFLQEICHDDVREWILLAEGSRLFTRAFIAPLLVHMSVVLCVLSAGKGEEERRRNMRSSQNAHWVRGVETRIAHICAEFSTQCTLLEWSSRGIGDIEKNGEALLELLM